MEEKDGKYEDDYYLENSGRGCGQLFGPSAAKDFLEDNELICVVRAHEVQPEGWKAHRFFDTERPVPMVLTVFSAPNYCSSYENKAAFLTFYDTVPVPTPKVQFVCEGLSVAQLGWTDAPYSLPGGGNIVQLTLPILAECIMGFFLAVLEVFQDEVDDDATPLPGDELIDPVEEKAAQERFDRDVHAMAKKVASLRVEKKEILASLCPPTITAESSDAVFKQMQQLDAKTELRGKAH
jgi:serine/threonine-protein phosphatase 2B catalytic subunit